MKLLSVNVGMPHPNPCKDLTLTGIDKRPVSASVMVGVPGARGPGAVGLAGDRVYGRRHGGPDQAVYAYAREDLDIWAAELNTTLYNGAFGENLTTTGIEVNGALIGERWHIGSNTVLEVSRPRIPCATFQSWMGKPDWIKQFTQAARPGAYLRVIEPGKIRAGDSINILYRPRHNVTVAITFRALTLEPDLLPLLLGADALPQEIKELVQSRA
jgi:MOSC domain-containing protein YiiM